MAARGTGEGGDPTAALLAALRQLLRPIARLVIERQITFPMLADLLKVVLIEVARDEFALRGKRLTDSRLSLLTGIHRKDVKRLRSELDREVGPSRNASLGALLVSRWVADPTYLDEQGEPRPRPRAASAGPGPSFEQLVLSVSKDIPVRSVLDEWVRQGIVEHDASDVVRLRVESEREVRALLAQTGAPAERLKLELTESSLIEDAEGVIERMEALRALGIRFSLDDFGTGYSSLAYLKRLPLAQLKIDQSFVRDVMSDPNDATIARTILALGSNLGLAVIAEGVETEEQYDFLAAQGCRDYQGYLFGRPLPLELFEAALAQG